MTKGYTIFGWIPGISIKDKYNETKSEEYEISSTHEDNHDDTITESGEDVEGIKEEIYKYQHPSDRENNSSNNIIKNQDQNNQEDATIENYCQEKLIEDEDMNQPDEIEKKMREK